MYAFSSPSNPFQQRGGQYCWPFGCRTDMNVLLTVFDSIRVVDFSIGVEMAEASSFSGGPPSGFDIEGGRDEQQEQMLQGPGYLNARANAVQAVQRTIGNICNK